jgi:hypothetical protein
MPQAIWKFTLELIDDQEIEMPLGSIILSTALQHGRIQLWVMVDTQIRDKEKRQIAIVGTGHEMSSFTASGKFIGTAITETGHFVWHVFDISRRR